MGTTRLPDFEQIQDFLHNVLGRKLFHIHSIHSRVNKKNTYATKTIVSEHTDDVLDWITKEQETEKNIYFAINLPRKGIRKKAKVKDLEWLDALHVDCDPPEGCTDLAGWQEDTLDELHNSKLIGEPSAAWISGYGVQAVWFLAKRLRATPENVAAVEDINRRLVAHFKGDHSAWNADRIFRLPGTVNYPNVKKLKAGREVTQARLSEVSPATYGLSDFDRLPAPPKAARSTYNPKRVDYTKYDYDAHYEPISAEELETTRPDIWDASDEAMARHGDRSEVAYGFIRTVATHIMDQLGCAAVDLLEDISVKRNLTEIVLDCGLDFVGHFMEKRYPNDDIGYSVGKVISHMADDGDSFSEAREGRANRRTANAKAAAKPVCDLDPQEARVLFITYVGDHVARGELPNAIGDKPESRQLGTEANMRQILIDARIVARWDIMRDEPRFTAMPAARENEKPDVWFERALINSKASDRAMAELSLVTDAIAKVGITQRDDIRKLLDAVAKENYFHPMEDYCTATPWDGNRRIHGLAARLTTPHPLAARYLEIFFRQGVAVVLSMRKWLATSEGEMIGSMLILDGPQEIGKTSFLASLIPPGMKSRGQVLKLGQSKETDSMAEVLSGMCANLDEFQQTMMRSEHSALKNFTTSTTDTYRLPYDRKWVIKPRMTHFCGTSNALQLFDPTGSRRFHVLQVDSILWDEPITPEELQQCYAEAWHDVVEDGQTWWLTKEEGAIRDAYNLHHSADAEEELAVSAYFNTVGSKHQDYWISSRAVAQLLGIKYNPSRWHIARVALLDAGCKYRDDVTYQGRRLRRVWSFPALPERYAAIEAGLQP